MIQTMTLSNESHCSKTNLSTSHTKPKVNFIFFLAYSVVVRQWAENREPKKKINKTMLWWRKVRKFMCYSPMKMPPTHALWLLFNALVTNVSRFYRCPSNFNELLHISHTVSFMNNLISSHIHTNSHRNTKWNCPPPPNSKSGKCMF